MQRNLLFCTYTALLAVTAWAQTYRFKDEPVPESKSLIMKTVFFVISQNDAAGNESKVSFDVRAKTTSESRADFTLREYGGIQLHVMRYEDFDGFVNAGKMCSTADDVSKQDAEKEDQLMIAPSRRHAGKSLDELQVFSYQVQFYGIKHHGSVALEKTITKTGAYVLVVSNCGNYDKALLTGSVYVKNPYGYLPGEDFAKMRFFRILRIVYAVLLVVWGLLCLRWYSVLCRFQIYILVAIALGLAECYMCHESLWHWNSTGDKHHALFRPAIVLSATRTTSSYVLMLLASLGWGLSRQVLESGTVCRIVVLAVNYTVLNCIREIMTGFGESYAPSSILVLFCFVPLSLLHGATFYWIFSALSKQIESLESMGQTVQLAVFQKLRRVLVTGVGAALCAVLVQVTVFSRNAAVYWRQEWYVTDFAPHAVFGVVLVSIMLLWAPSEDIPRTQFMQIDGAEKGDKVAPGADSSIWSDEMMEGGGDDDDDSFWAATKRNDQDDSPQPEVLGKNRRRNDNLDALE